MRRWIVCSVVRWFCALVLLAPWYGSALADPAASAEEKSVVTGRISDVEGRGVEGAMVFAYASADVRRPADFISARTERDGLFRLVMSPGTYWLVARVRKAEGYGPLMPGDKHSGDPREIELASGSEVDMNLVVADLKDAIKMRKRETEGPVKVSGRIVDENGSPVRGAYAIASRNEKISGVPDFLSAWVDDEGRYTMYVPRGTYYLGGAVRFPPGLDYFVQGKVTLDGDISDLDIVRKSRDGK